MQTHRLRCAKIVRVTEDGDTNTRTVHITADMAPASAGFVSFDAIRFTFRSEEKCLVLPIPRPIAAKAQSTVVIFGKFQGTGRRAVLGGDEINHPVSVRAAADVVKGDLPGFVQSDLRFSGRQIDKPMARLEATVDETAPGLVHGDELDLALSLSHVPKVRLAAFKFRLGPRKPDAVMMEVIRRIVVGDEFADGREKGVKVAAALEDRFDIGPRQFDHVRLIMKNGLVGDGAFELAAFADHLHAITRIVVRFGRNQSINPGRAVFEFLFNEASMALTVGLKLDHVPTFIGELLELRRAGGQGEPDDGIAAVVVAGKHPDLALAARGVETEGTAEEQYCIGGRNFLH